MSNLFQRVKRNKKKFLIFGGVIAAGYASYKFSKYIQNYNSNPENNNTLHFKIQKAHYFQSMLSNCSTITDNLLASIEMEIDSKIDLESVAYSLGILTNYTSTKGNLIVETSSNLSSEMKLELWQKFKVLSFTKLSLLLFCWSYLTVAVHIQMAILAGHLFATENGAKHYDLFSTFKRYIFASRHGSNHLDSNFQKDFINFTLVQLKQQIPRWIELIHCSATEIVGKTSLKRLMTAGEVVASLGRIRAAVQGDVFALCVQGMQQHNSNKRLEGPMYVTMTDVFQGAGLGHIDRLAAEVEGRVCAGLLAVVGRGQGGEPVSRQPLAKFLPYLWSVGTGGVCTISVGDSVKNYCRQSQFRLMVFETYETGLTL